jgi:long-chain acyl-CoA synthetase
VKQYDSPLLVQADPNANATDLLIGRVAKTPDR